MHSLKEIVESLIKEENKMLRTLKSLDMEGFMFGEGKNNKPLKDTEITVLN